jgi:hypothetical protein
MDLAHTYGGITMKPYLYALIFILAVFICGGLVQVANSHIAVTDYQITPSVLMPDEKGIVTVTLSNTGSSGAGIPSPAEQGLNDGSSEPLGVSPSPVIDSVFLNGKKDIDVLAGNGEFEGQVGPGQSVQISFVIKAPQVSGIYFAELLIRLRNQESIKYPIAVNVNTPISAVRQPALILSQSSSGPIRPGESYPVQITLANHGVSQAKDITVRVKETGSSFAPLQTNAFHIEKLKQGEESSGEITFNTDKNVKPGIHKIPVEIQYTTPDKGEIITTETLSLDIRGDADVSLMSIETEPSRIMKNTPFDLVIRLDNSGTGDAEAVRARISLPFQGGKEAFIGRIEPHNDAPAVFILDSGEAGEYPYILNIMYKDDWGEHERTENLTLTVQSPPDNTLSLIIGILLVLFGFLGYRMWMRRGDV